MQQGTAALQIASVWLSENAHGYDCYGVGGESVYFFVKSEIPCDMVDEFTSKLADKTIRGVEGNVSYVSPDGCVGYDIVECRDEQDCRQKYSHLSSHGLRIDEITPIQPMGQFIEAWKRQRPAA